MSRRTRRLSFERLPSRSMLAVLLVDTAVDVVDADDQVTSLREAIYEANELDGVDTIQFHESMAGSKIVLSEGLLEITGPMQMMGPGPDRLTIDASGNDETPGERDGRGTSVIQVELRRGDEPIELSGMTFIGGDSPSSGGAIANRTTGPMVLTDMIFRDNHAMGEGGAIVTSGPLLLDRVWLHGNSAIDDGGGVYILGRASFRMFDSTVSANSTLGSSAADGGGLALRSGRNDVNEIVNSTIVDNVADERGLGGGLHVRGGTTIIRNSTIARNSNDSNGNAAVSGVAVEWSSNTTTLIIENSIIADNVQPTRDLWVGHRVDWTMSHSLLGSGRFWGNDLTPSLTPDENGNLVGTVESPFDPKLNLLADNGGPFPTSTLQLGSPAINAGDPNFGQLDFDQRGAPYQRVIERLDMGAVEFIPPGEGRVVGRHIFYNDSAWDGRDSEANTLDALAIAVDKQPLLPGKTASFANYTSYSKGINGIIVDVNGVPDVAKLTLSDFAFRVGRNNSPATWEEAPPPRMSIAPAAEFDESHRITFTWENHQIKQTWLQVVVKATDTTDLPWDDVFYFGNAIGETGDSEQVTTVSDSDISRLLANQRGPFELAPITDVYDLNRDRLVSSIDVVIARDNRAGLLTALPLITPAVHVGARPVRIGDVNRDGVFDSTDLVLVFQAGQYEEGMTENSAYDTGDWNGDGDFDSTDLVLAFQAGHYQTAASSRAAEIAVESIFAASDRKRLKALVPEREHPVEAI